MSKSIVFKVLFPLTFLAAAIVWLLTVSIDDFNLNPSIVPACVCGIWGVAFIMRGLVAKSVGAAKKMNILIGTVLLVLTVLLVVNIVAIKDEAVLPIIAIVVSAGFVLCVLAVGGKKWDQADNKKVGYKNYYERKAEEEKNRSDS
ncbi:MAG: hypothetical protein LBF12_02280 [Christensenellaceae bacterium]|jgi:hypothetical protein|nr:hypothetical protein [Christensenellaceae bacterium]